MLEYNEIKERKIIIHENEPCEVMSAAVSRKQQMKPQNQVKLKSLLSGRTWNETYGPSNKVKEAEISKRKVKFLYTNKGEYWFCDPDKPSDRFQLKEEIIGEAAKFLKPNEIIDAIVWEHDDEEQIINIKLPIKIEYTIKDAPPSIKGNTASGGGKVVTLENDLKINAPFFLNIGDKIRVNTETGEYVERVNE